MWAMRPSTDVCSSTLIYALEIVLLLLSLLSFALFFFTHRTSKVIHPHIKTTYAVTSATYLLAVLCNLLVATEIIARLDWNADSDLTLIVTTDMRNACECLITLAQMSNLIERLFATLNAKKYESHNISTMVLLIEIIIMVFISLLAGTLPEFGPTTGLPGSAIMVFASVLNLVVLVVLIDVNKRRDERYRMNSNAAISQKYQTKENLKILKAMVLCLLLETCTKIVFLSVLIVDNNSVTHISTRCNIITLTISIRLLLHPWLAMISVAKYVQKLTLPCSQKIDPAAGAIRNSEADIRNLQAICFRNLQTAWEKAN